jgi:hypothetical protein
MNKKQSDLGSLRPPTTLVPSAKEAKRNSQMTLRAMMNKETTGKTTAATTRTMHTAPQGESNQLKRKKVAPDDCIKEPGYGAQATYVVALSRL